MPFKQFQYLKEVMVCRSINRAAQNLYISPQALRSAIGSMEDRLGFKVFERSKQGVTLTPEGEQIEADIDEIIRISERWGAIRSARERLSARLGREPALSELSEATGLAPEEIARNALERGEGQSSPVILLHDSHPFTTTPEAVRQIIRAYKARGYRFGVLTADTRPLVFSDWWDVLSGD